MSEDGIDEGCGGMGEILSVERRSADLHPARGHGLSGHRPVGMFSRDLCNARSGTGTAVCIEEPAAEGRYALTLALKVTKLGAHMGEGHPDSHRRLTADARPGMSPRTGAFAYRLAIDGGPLRGLKATP